MSPSTQDWRRQAAGSIASNRAFTTAAMQRPQLQHALYNHVDQLQRAVDRGQFTSQQALDILKTDVKNASRIIQAREKITVSTVDQTDLNNPMNMQNALQNPNSFASQQADDTAAAIVEGINESAASVEQQIATEQAASDQASTDTQNADLSADEAAVAAAEPSQNTEPVDESESHDRIDKACKEVAAAAVVMIGLGDDAVDKALIDVSEKIGKELGFDTSKIGEAEEKAIDDIEASNPFKMELKPPKETPDEKD